ncbi:MAG: methyl-accepting chemotaxis protein [Sterolibacterium sp.]|nr:methyl-accepting chemotaxis protein [Sterolibacterium sp.]
MKINSPVNNIEKRFAESESLYSRTNLKGQIEEINDAFVDVSGFTREELLGKSHNIVRHPDVPPAVFKDFWDDLKQGRPWRGVVKNWRKDGGYYWVVANASPVRDAQRKVVGYQSVRFAPTKEEVRAAEQAYQRMAKGDRSIGIRQGKIVEQGLTLGRLWRSDWLLWAPLALAAIAPAIAMLLDVQSKPLALFSIVFVVGFISLFHYRNKQALEQLGDWIDQLLISGDLRQALPQNLLRHRFVGTISQRMFDFVGAMRATVRGVEDVAQQVAASTQEARASAENVHQASQVQSEATASSAAVVEQMAVSISEVASQAEMSREASLRAGDEAQVAMAVSDDAARQIQALASFIQTTAQQIAVLGQRSDEINRIVGLIREIADQTNLLALNAAIEAARAGEQGRGFAVVADEVRKLAERTAQATHEISGMTGAIRDEAASAVEAMDSGVARVNSGVAVVHEVGKALSKISESMQSAIDMVVGISHATSEQRNAMNLFASDVERVSIMTQNNATAAIQAKAVAERLETISVRMLASARQYQI